MTTEIRPDPRRTGARILVRSSAAALLAGVLVSVIAWLVAGTPGLLAGAIGTAVTVAVLFSGALVVTVVAELMPSASLLVALMTYTLQVVVLAVVLVPLGSSDWSDAHLDAPWLGAAVIAGALVWTVAQVLLATRARIPVYDLDAASSRAPARAEGGAR